MSDMSFDDANIFHALETVIGFYVTVDFVYKCGKGYIRGELKKETCSFIILQDNNPIFEFPLSEVKCVNASTCRRKGAPSITIQVGDKE